MAMTMAMPTLPRVATCQCRTAFRRTSKCIRASLLAVLVLAWVGMPNVVAEATSETETAPPNRYQTAGARAQAIAALMEKCTWVETGEPQLGRLHDWDETTAFCYQKNASLMLHVDEPNSSAQPYLLRVFGQTEEAQEVHAFVVQGLEILQTYLGKLTAVFWTWTDLRVVVRGENVQQLRYSYLRSPSPVCTALQAATNATPGLDEYIPEPAIKVVQATLYGLSKVLCAHCVNGCPVECVGTAENPDECTIQMTPFHVPCLAVSSPIKPFLASSFPTLKFWVAFDTVLSPKYVQNFFIGLLLFMSAPRLARSRSFHYLLGATIGISFSAALAIYFFTKQTKSAAKAIPGVQILQTVGAMVSVIVPFTGLVVLPSFYRVISWGLRYLGSVWSAETIMGIPHLGKIYFVCFGLLGCLLVWWNQWGATPKTEEQSKEEIEELGRLDEDLPLTGSQAVLARILQLIGLSFLFNSTSSTEIALIVIVLVMLTGVFQFLGATAYFWYHFEETGRHVHLISVKEYEEQGISETEKALKELRKYLEKNPKALEQVKEESEIRLRRFAHGRDHLDTLQAKERDARNFKASTWFLRRGISAPSSCVLQ